jgi:hypothetical protein
MRRLAVMLALIAAVTSAVTPNVSAQTDWSFGAKGGVTVATLHGNVSGWLTLQDVDVLADLKDSRTGFVGGVFMNIGMTPLFSVQVEALYIQKGGTGKGAFTSDNTTFVDADLTVELDYIEFPAVAMVSFPAGPMEVSGYGGVSVAFNTNAKLIVEVGGSERSFDIGAIVKATEFNGMFGLGLSFGVGAVSLIADGRYEYSLSAISDVTADDVKNGVASIVLGVTIPTGI